MNICHIGTIAFETKESQRELKSIGGISGYILELIRYSHSKSIKIIFFGKIYNFNANENVSYVEVQNELTGTIQFLFHLLIKSFLKRIPKNSIIHAHRPDHLAAFYFFNRRPSVISLHGQQAHTVNIRKGKIVRTIYHNMEKYAMGKAKVLIAVDAITHDFYSQLYPQYKDKIVTIPTGVNTSIFKPLESASLRKKYGIKASDKVLLYVGRIEPPKRLDKILEAFKLVYEIDSGFKLVIIGDGVLKEKMEAESKKLQLDTAVLFVGVRKRVELPLYFNMADASILLSDNEGSPLSVKESLACGVPVIANDVGDISGIVKNDFNGYIVKLNDVNDIANKIVLATNNSQAIKSNCIQSIQAYTIPNVSEEIIQIYNKLEHE